MIFLGRQNFLQSTGKIVKSVMVMFLFSVLIGYGFFGGQILLSDGSVNGDILSASIQTAAAESVAQVPVISQILAAPSEIVKEIPEIEAGAALSVQMAVGDQIVLYSKNPDKKLPIASLTKLMTALVVLDHYNLGQQVTVSNAAMSQEGEQGSLKTGEQLSVENLLYITLIESSNRAAYALAEAMGTDNFISLMNEHAKRLGMAGTHFEDATGLDAKSYSTARDIAVLTQYLYENYPLFRRIVSVESMDLYLQNGIFHHKLETTNKLLGEIPGIIGGKTGWTDAARGCFMVIRQNPQGTVGISIILGAEDRELEMKKLLEK